MRSAKRSCASASVVFAAILLTIGEAQSRTFDYVFCNQSNLNVFVAVVAQLSATDQRFKVQGWWTIPAGTCGNIGAFPWGWTYYYAEEEDLPERRGDPGSTVHWGGDDVEICVTYPGPFERILSESYACGANEAIQGFKGVFVKPDTGSITVTLNLPR